jgi:hypothetical protein
MRQDWMRLLRVVGGGAVLVGGLALAQEAAQPAAAPTPAPGRREETQEMKDLRAKIEAKEKAILADPKNAELKKEADDLEAKAKAKRDEGTPEARREARGISRQREEKLAAVDPELKELYAKMSELRRQQFGGRGGQGGGQGGGAKPAQ